MTSSGDGTTPSWAADPTPTPPTDSFSGSANNNSPPAEKPSWLTPDSNDAEHQKQSLEIVTGVEEPTSTTTTTNTNNTTEESKSKTWGEYFRDTFRRDGRLVLITLLIILLMNLPYVQWALYPFTIFSTWIHEICHGLAAAMAGGEITKLEIFPDTSGLAHTIVRSDRRGFVVSAGYQGTAVIGCLLLLIRRTKRGPRAGTMAIAFMMLLSVILWIRNAFGICFILLLGVLLAAAAWKLPSNHMRNVYMCLAVTCALNAITRVQDLFGANHTVNGQESSTDAHSMADIKGGTSGTWATIWLLLAIVLTIVGFLFAIPGPDEVADFTCCGVCQDLGVFACFNLKGQRLWSKMFGKNDSNENATNSNDDANGPSV